MGKANWAHPLLLIPERRGHDLGKKTICQRPPPPTLEKSIVYFARTFAVLCTKTFWLVIRIAIPLVKHCWPSICFCPGSTYCCIGVARDGRYFPVCVICSVYFFADLYYVPPVFTIMYHQFFCAVFVQSRRIGGPRLEQGGGNGVKGKGLNLLPQFASWIPRQIQIQCNNKYKSLIQRKYKYCNS